MSPVHGYGHRDGAVHGGDHLVVGGLQQADVVHTIHIAEKYQIKKDYQSREIRTYNTN